jgi:3-deoxy-D-manno-octulosonic-acid transferase
MAWQVTAYLALARSLGLVAPVYLRRRLAKGREDPLRWREKLGQTTAPRPEGRLVWLHAVGLGEVMALRGLIHAMAAEDATLNFLITSMARSSAQVVSGNLPPRTQHQFLPLDAPRFVARFLDHWRPDLAVWSEQDLWPAAVLAADRRGIPLALVNARMNAAAFQRRKPIRGLLARLYPRFRLVTCQDGETARHLGQLGARQAEVSGSLKATSPPLGHDPDMLAAMQRSAFGRNLWLLASSHPEDEAVALKVQAGVWAEDQSWLLVIAPREPDRWPEIAAAAEALQLPLTRRMADEEPGGAVYLADTFGEMGLWYRLCPITVMGGTFGPVEGHNPWEPAALGSAILHGPRLRNFAADYAVLDGSGAALEVSPLTLADALDRDLGEVSARAQDLWRGASGGLAPLARRLVALVAPG